MATKAKKLTPTPKKPSNPKPVGTAPTQFAKKPMTSSKSKTMKGKC